LIASILFLLASLHIFGEGSVPRETPSLTENLSVPFPIINALSRGSESRDSTARASDSKIFPFLPYHLSNSLAFSDFIWIQVRRTIIKYLPN